MGTMISDLLILGIAMLVNVALGMYNKIGVEKLSFDKTVFINGIIKSIIVAGSFLGLSYCFLKTDLSTLGVTPDLIMLSAIVLYVGKACKNLMSILGVTLNNSNK